MSSQSRFLAGVSGMERDRRKGDEQLGECAVQQPGDDGEIAALVVGREENRVFVGGSIVGSNWCLSTLWRALRSIANLCLLRHCA